MEAEDAFDDEGDMKKVDELSWKKIADACMKDGFRDGIVEGQEKTLQDGFDMGYAKGYQQNFPIAMIRGVMGALRSYLFRSNLMDSQEIVHIAKELIGLEKDILEFNKTSVSDKNKDSQDDKTFLIDSDGENPSVSGQISASSVEASITSCGEETSVTSEEKHNNQETKQMHSLMKNEKLDDEIRYLSEQFESIKKRSVHIMEQLGLSELCSLICDISWHDVRI